MNKKTLCLLLAAALVFAAGMPLLPQAAVAAVPVASYEQTTDTMTITIADAGEWETLCNAAVVTAHETGNRIIETATNVVINLPAGTMEVTKGLMMPYTAKRLTINGNGCVLEVDVNDSVIEMTNPSGATIVLNGKCTLESTQKNILHWQFSGTLELGQNADITVRGGSAPGHYGNSAITASVHLTVAFGSGSRLVAKSGEAVGINPNLAIYGNDGIPRPAVPSAAIWVQESNGKVGSLTFTGSPDYVLIEDGTDADNNPALWIDEGGRIVDNANLGIVSKPGNRNMSSSNDTTRDGVGAPRVSYLKPAPDFRGDIREPEPMMIPVAGVGITDTPPSVRAVYDKEYGALTIKPTREEFLAWLAWIGGAGEAVFDTSYLLSEETMVRIDPQWILDLFAEDASDEMKALAEQFQTLTVVNRAGRVSVPVSWLLLAAEAAKEGEMIEITIGSGSVVFRMTIGGKSADLKVTAPATLGMKFTPAQGRSPESYTLRSKDTGHVGAFANYEGGMISALVYETGHYDAVDNPDAPAYIPDSAADVFLSYAVNASVLNLRKGGSMNFAIVGKLPRGTAVVVEYLSGNWAYVHTDSGATGWVYSKYLTAL